MRYILNLVNKTFRRRLGKNIGTLIGIALSVSLMVGVQITINSFADEAVGYFVESIGEKDIVISGTNYPINNYTNVIENIEQSDLEYAGLNVRVTQNVAVYNLKTGDLRKRVNFNGIKPDENPLFGYFYDENGTKFTPEVFSNLLVNNRSVLVGYGLRDRLNLSINDTVTIRIGQLDLSSFSYNYVTYDFFVVGIVADQGKGKEYGGRALWTSIDNLRSFMGYNESQVSEINIALTADRDKNPVSSEEAKNAEAKLQRILRTDETGYFVIAFRALVLDTADTIISDVLLTFNIFGALIIFSGVLLLVNIQLIQVEDRVQQLGIMRAIGSRKSEIISMFFIESIILGFFGSLLGLLGGYGMSVFLVWQIGQTFFEGAIIIRPVVTLSALIYSVVIGLVLAIGAGVLPAIKASRIDVIEVIRGIKKSKPKTTNSAILGVGLTLIAAGLSIFFIRNSVSSYFIRAGWSTAIGQWFFMGATVGVLIGLCTILGYLYSKKVMGTSMALSLIFVSILMMLFALPELKDVVENNKMLITCIVVLALGSIILVGVNLVSVTTIIQNILYKTRIKKGVSLISSRYMTSKGIRSTLTFGIFVLVLTMQIFASIYQTTYAYNTLDSIEFNAGGAPIYIQLDTPVQNESLVNVEQDLLELDSSISYVQGINSTLTFIRTDQEVQELEIPADIFPARIDLIYNETMKNETGYKFEFIFGQSIGKFNDKYKPAASEEYQKDYSLELWDLFLNRTKFDNQGNIDNENGLPTVISTSSIFKPGDIFNITGLNRYGFPVNTTVTVLGVLKQYPFSLSGGIPNLLVTEEFVFNLWFNFNLYPKYTRYLVKTNEDFQEGRNPEIVNKIERFFNANDSDLVKNNDYVAASVTNVWDQMLDIIDFEIRTFDFLQYFIGFGLIVGALGMVVIAIRNVSERKREIGMMRAIGYKRSQIIGTIMLELFILAGLGLFMGILNSLIIGFAYARVYDWLLIIPLLRVLMYSGIMIGIALIASIIPGMKASQITPAEALRYVG